MKNNPKISVIIPCYNLGQYVQDAVRSVYLQTQTDLEIIIVNDGSNDDHTEELLSEVVHRYPDVMLLNKKNGGLSDARNFGIAKARGEYIVCLDADDMLKPDYLQKTASILDKDHTGKIAFVSTWIQEFGLRSDIWRPKVEKLTDVLLTNHFIAGSMFRKEAWSNVGGYKKEMQGGYEDWEFWLSIIESGKKWEIVEEPLFLYRIRQNSMLQGATEKHKQLYTKLINFHKKLFIENGVDVISDFSSVNQQLRGEISSLSERTSQITSDLYKANEELNLLKMSRVTRYNIVLRDILINWRSRAKDYFARTKKRIHIWAGKLIPEFLKLKIHRFNDKILGIKRITVLNTRIRDNSPVISIITPFYNHGATILETVESVRGQSFQNFEYIIVNDGSDIKNSVVLEQIHESNIRVITHRKNLGNGSPAAARNTGIKVAKGKYIMCLDADDKLDPTFIEKALILLETNPDVSIVTTDTNMFGAVERTMEYCEYNPENLLKNNMVITAAIYRKEAWEAVGGYKSEIGYEDWEFWISLAERGYFGKRIAEKLFFYRTADVSRYQEDVKNHHKNLEKIQQLHPSFYKNVEKYYKKYSSNIRSVSPSTAFINLNKASDYLSVDKRRGVIVMVPWLTFGGAETLLYNFCRGLSAEYSFTFITGYKSKNEWENRFKELGSFIYHLPNILDNYELKLEFISNYITTRDINILHVVHCQYPLDMLSELKKRHPNLKIIVTMFNSGVDFFWKSLELSEYIDTYTSDNTAVTTLIKEKLPNSHAVSILNGIDVFGDYAPENYTPEKIRKDLGLRIDERVICFIGRLSEEKNISAVIKLATSLKDKQDVRVLVVGDGPEKRKVIEAAKKNDKLLFLGYRNDISAVLAATDIFFLPSHIEGFPQTLVEAMSMGNALVTSRAGEMSKVVTDDVGRTFRSNRVDDAVRIVTEMLEEGNLLNKMKLAARQKAIKNYTYNRMVDEYFSLYKDI